MSKPFTIGILVVMLTILGLLSRQVKNVVDPQKADQEAVEREKSATANPAAEAPKPYPPLPPANTAGGNSRPAL